MSSQMLDDIAEQERLKDCICPVVKVNGRPTASRNWNPDCPVHKHLYRKDDPSDDENGRT